MINRTIFGDVNKMNFREIFNEVNLEFVTDKNLFSPNHIDKGTKYLLEELSLNSNDKVLDLGCGIGVVGIYCIKKFNVKKVVMCDIAPMAIECSKQNIILNNINAEIADVYLSDGLSNFIENDFSVVISNPPYHTDFSVAKRFIEDSFFKMKLGAKIYMVTKRKEWYKNKLISAFGGVKIVEKDGYYIFCAEKRSSSFANRTKNDKQKGQHSRKLKRKIKNQKSRG